MAGAAAFPELETARLRLREIRHSDAKPLLAIHGDVQAMRYFGFDAIHTEEQAHRMVSHFAQMRQAATPAFRWGLERKADGAFLGTCGVFNWFQAWRKCALGYELGCFAWGQGYMTEALRTVLGWTFDQLAVERVEAQVHPDNTASLKLATLLGFQVEGRLREGGFWNGRRHDLLQLGMLKREFVH